MDVVGAAWFGVAMTTVAIFHSVLGVRAGVLDAAERLRQDGHVVLVPDLFEGRTFDEYPPAMTFAWQELGQESLLRRASDAVAGLPEGFVTVGFSLGCVLAGYLATQRTVSGVVMASGAVPVSLLGPDVRWPSGVPAQTHSTVDDPWREQEELEHAVRDVEEGGGTIEVFDYPGSGHLFTDPTLPHEYDPAATEVFWSRVVPFLRGL
jgi:dienelactone hydrolase